MERHFSILQNLEKTCSVLPSSSQILFSIEEIQQEIIELNFQTVKELYNKDKLFLAHKKWFDLKNSLSHHSKNNLPEAIKLEEYLTQEHIKSFTSKLENERNEAWLLIHNLEDLTDWNLVHRQDGLKTYYKNEPSSPIHSLRVEGILNCNLLNILAVIIESDLYKNWVPFLKDCKPLEQLSPYKQFIWGAMELPFPLWNRDACLYGYGVDLLDFGAILINVRSCCSSDPPHRHILPPARHVRVDCNITGILLQPISPTKTKLIGISNLDPKLAIVPYWLINLVTKQIVYFLFQEFEKKSIQVSTSEEFQKRIREKPEIYQDLKQRLEKYV